MLLFRWQSFDVGTILLTVDADFAYSERPATAIEVQALTETIRAELCDFDSAPSWQQIPLMKLGAKKVNVYLTTSDDRIVEYGPTEVLFEAQSDFQHIQIIDTLDHGRMLLLDGLVNLAENDRVAYTHFLMGLPKTNYSGMKVLILGGGDGALLKELLDLPHAPSHVTMIDIDEAVMKACSKFMPSVCGSYLRSRTGPNFEVIVDDAFKQMEAFRNQGRKFDIIFGDLTDTPVAASATSCRAPSGAWRFMRSILDGAFSLLDKNSENSRFFTHCNGKNVPEVLEMFEEFLTQYPEFEFRRKENFVPSFMETWVFYELKVKR